MLSFRKNGQYITSSQYSFKNVLVQCLIGPPTFVSIPLELVNKCSYKWKCKYKFHCCTLQWLHVQMFLVLFVLILYMESLILKYKIVYCKKKNGKRGQYFEVLKASFSRHWKLFFIRSLGDWSHCMPRLVLVDTFVILVHICLQLRKRVHSLHMWIKVSDLNTV